MSNKQNTQLIEQIKEEYEELVGNLKSVEFYLALSKNLSDEEIISVLKEKIDNLKKIC